MERVAIDDRSPVVVGDAVERRGLDEALGTDDVAVVHYRIPAGEGLPAGLHAHADRADLFVVLRGTAVFEVYDPDDGGREVVVGAGEAVRFPPGSSSPGATRREAPTPAERERTERPPTGRPTSR